MRKRNLMPGVLVIAAIGCSQPTSPEPAAEETHVVTNVSAATRMQLPGASASTIRFTCPTMT